MAITDSERKDQFQQERNITRFAEDIISDQLGGYRLTVHRRKPLVHLPRVPCNLGYLPEVTSLSHAVSVSDWLELLGLQEGTEIWFILYVHRKKEHLDIVEGGMFVTKSQNIYKCYTRLTIYQLKSYFCTEAVLYWIANFKKNNLSRLIQQRRIQMGGGGFAVLEKP